MFKYENLTPSLARSSPPPTPNAARFFQDLSAKRSRTALATSPVDGGQLSSKSNEHANSDATAVELGVLIINATVTNKQSDPIPVKL